MRYPEKEFSLSDLAKESGVAKPHMNPLLHELMKLNLVTIIKLSKIWRIKANQQNDLFLKMKILTNLQRLYLSGLIEILNEGFGNPKAIIVFGSFRNGEDLSTSDIDLAIEKEDISEYKTISLPHGESIEKSLGRRIQIHLFNKKNVDRHVFNNIANGIVLSGFLEVNP